MRDEAVKQGTITGRHVLIAVIAFFAVIFAANGVFLYTAISTHTGVVSNEPYRKGLHYNDRIEADRQQQQLGWKEDIAIAPDGRKITVALLDKAGNPISGLSLEGRLGRPATEAMDRTLDLKETAPGSYTAEFAALEPGAWLLDVVARRLTSTADEVVWRVRKRLTWQQP